MKTRKQAGQASARQAITSFVQSIRFPFIWPQALWPLSLQPHSFELQELLQTRPGQAMFKSQAWLQ